VIELYCEKETASFRMFAPEPRIRKNFTAQFFLFFLLADRNLSLANISRDCEVRTRNVFVFYSIICSRANVPRQLIT
jgi:hypothetical protein